MKTVRMKTEKFGSTVILKRKMIPMQNLNCVSLRMTMSMKWLLMHSTNIWTVVSLMN